MEQQKVQKKLKVLAESDGGKILIDALLQEILRAIEHISAQYSRMTLEEFISKGAELNAKLNLMRSLTKAKQNEEMLADLLKR